MPIFTVLWIWICTYLGCAGWVLSALHELNATGYAVAIVAGAGALLVWQSGAGLRRFPGNGWHRWRRRFRRSFPLAFLVLGSLEVAGGLIYPPSNYDALSYRVPRVLHWLAAGQWHWIHTVFPRLNVRGCGTEWVSAPWLALTHTDRLLFLINAVSFCLLPGLVYSVFTRLGVRRRAAWHWMWLAPTGYGFLLQAGSIGNDLLAAVFALAAVDFALRAKDSRSPRDFFTSVLAAALMTGVKASGIPLLLPWGVAMLPCLPLALRWPLRSAAMGVAAIAVSFLPTAYFNQHYNHDWSGTKVESKAGRNDPVLRLGSNLALVMVQNLAPPVFPLAGAWNAMVKKWMPNDLSVRLHQVMAEPEAAEFTLEEMQIEENSGLGMGVTMLVLISLAAVAGKRGSDRGSDFKGPRELIWRRGICAGTVISTLAIISQSAIGGLARVLIPFYLLVLPWLLGSPGQAQLVTRRWWRRLAAVVFLLAGLLVVISPARPLYPAATIFSVLHRHYPQSAAIARAARVYEVYRNRNDAFAPVLALLPAGTKTLGLFTYDDPEAALWRPFGSRRIEHICPADTAEDLRLRGIEYVLIAPGKLRQHFNMEPAEWARSRHAGLIQIIPLDLRATDGVADWWLLKLQ